MNDECFFLKFLLLFFFTTQDTDVHYRSLNGEGNFNWRFKFPLRYSPNDRMLVLETKTLSNRLTGTTTATKLPPVLTLQVFDSDTFSPNDFLGSVDIDLRSVTSAGRAVRSPLGRLLGLRPGRPVSLFRSSKSGLSKVRNWFEVRRGGGGEISGRIDAEIELLPREEAEARKNAVGREEPNEYPRLEPPNRPASSFRWFSSPWKTFRYRNEIETQTNKI